MQKKLQVYFSRSNEATNDVSTAVLNLCKGVGEDEDISGNIETSDDVAYSALKRGCSPMSDYVYEIDLSSTISHHEIQNYGFRH